jgi:uncharacterized protein involved in exopolysaccharide biosynthesis
MPQKPTPQPQGETEHESPDLFDSRQLGNYVRYVTGSVRRRKRLALTLFSVIVLGTLLGLVTFPKTYHVETKVLAQRNPVLPVRGDQPGVDTPTRAAAETVLRHDNLVALVKQTDLINHYAAHRAPAVRVKDAILGLLKSDDTEEDRIEGMVETLEKKLAVWTNEGTVTIAIDWSNAQMAFRLVDDAQTNFLESRHVSEISAIAESVGILQSHASSLRADIDSAVEAIKKLRAEQDAAADPSRPAPRMVLGTGSAAAPRRAADPDPEIAKLRVIIDAKDRAINDLEDFRRRRLSELQARLAEQRAVYTENHPIIVDLQQTIASLSKESPQVTSLRKEVAALQAELDRKNAAATAEADSAGEPRPAPPTFVAAPPPQLPNDILSLDREPREERDPAMVYARGQLRDAMDKYAALRTQIQSAQIDLETAEAAFKYRYAVITPAQVPKRPTKPNAPLVMLASLVAALLVSMIAAVFADIRSGRLIERWQVEDLLDKPILGEVDLPALPEHERE